MSKSYPGSQNTNLWRAQVSGPGHPLTDNVHYSERKGSPLVESNIRALQNVLTKLILTLPLHGSHKGRLVDMLAQLRGASSTSQRQHIMLNMEAFLKTLESEHQLDYRDSMSIKVSLIALWDHVNIEKR